MQLKGKLAVITGASSGIGEATAKLLAREGASTILVGRKAHELERVAAAIHAGGGSAEPCVLDVAETTAVKQTLAQAGEIDILVNCAGVYYPTAGGAMRESEWRAMIEVNLCGTINTCNAVLPGMQARGSGHIVNMASVAAIAAVGGYSVYCATKAAVVMLSRSLAAEFAPFGVHVNVVAPGNTATPMNAKLRTSPAMAGALAKMAEATPSPRTFTPPEDIARCALFLVSSASAPLYGAVLVADEGLSLEVDCAG
jgi:3-oxoacyl-[acyl-carrier protein] reductase